METTPLGQHANQNNSGQRLPADLEENPEVDDEDIEENKFETDSENETDGE